MKSIEELAQAQAAMAAQVNGQGVAPDVIQQTINNLTPKEETQAQEQEPPAEAQTEVKDGDVKADDAGEARKEEQQPAAAEKRKRKRLSGFKEPEPPAQEVELPDEVKSRLALLDEMLEMPAVKLAYESYSKGKDFLKEAVDMSAKNPENMSLKDKYKVQLEREGLTGDDVEEALEDFDTLRAHEQLEKVRDISKVLDKEYKEYVKSIKVSPKEYVDPEKARRAFMEETSEKIETIRGQEFYGIKMGEKEMKEFKKFASEPLFPIDETGKPNMEEYLGAVWKLRMFDTIIENQYEEAYKEGFDAGVIFKKDSDSHSGSAYNPFMSSNATKPSQSPAENSLEYHKKNAPEFMEWLGFSKK